MKRKIIMLLVLTLVLTSVLGFTGIGTKSTVAAPYFKKSNFVDGVVIGKTLNVRQGPDTKYPITCTLKKGQKVKVFGMVGDWYALYEVSGGCVGAAYSKYIKVADSANIPSKTPVTKKATPKATPKGTGAKTTPSTGKTTPPSGISQDEQTLLDLINKERANGGVAALQFDMELMKVARLKAKDMVDNNYFAHESPTYGSPFDMMRQFGVSFKNAGENIAGNDSIEDAVKKWMASEGHRKNIMNGNFNYTGVGIVESPTYGKVLVQQFIGR
ncbi:MAG: CAP domain-containing protein [Clostridia bacterium]|nr:CAP domain-containing protein [Clostridia bacterium]